MAIRQYGVEGHVNTKYLIDKKHYNSLRLICLEDTNSGLIQHLSLSSFTYSMHASTLEIPLSIYSRQEVLYKLLNRYCDIVNIDFIQEDIIGISRTLINDKINSLVSISSDDFNYSLIFKEITFTTLELFVKNIKEKVFQYSYIYEK